MRPQSTTSNSTKKPKPRGYTGDRSTRQRRNTTSQSNPDWDSTSSSPTLTPSSSLRSTPIPGTKAPNSIRNNTRNRTLYQINLAPGSNSNSRESTLTPLQDINTKTDHHDTPTPIFQRAISSVSSMFRSSNNNYAGLGQYPNKQGRFSFRNCIRIAGASIALLGLLYLVIASVGSSSRSTARDDVSGMRDGVDLRLQSKHCDVPHPGRPLVQYVLMIDAGSTGSRIHVYKFNYCKDHPELEDEVFVQTKPGFSDYINSPQEAAQSLDKLMEAALENVPKSLQSCTPIAVKATAGLRIRDPKKSVVVLETVQKYLRDKYPFKLIPNNPVEIMDDKYEGIYAWITVNYLLGTLGHPDHKTAATFDLGGASTQIVFEPAFENWNNKTGGPLLAPGEHRFDMKYGSEEYTLYQHSYLGYGLMEARKSIKKLIAKDASGNGKFSVESACFPPGFREEIKVEGNESQSVLIKGAMKVPGNSSDGNTKCIDEVKKVLKKDAMCETKPCSFNGVYQPPLEKVFPENPFYIFSYFYDRTYPLGLRDEFKLSDIKKLLERVCKFDPEEFSTKEQKDELASEDHYCLDLSFQYSMLRYGVEMPDDRVVRSTRKINDIETGWCLGASLAILDQNRYCK